MVAIAHLNNRRSVLDIKYASGGFLKDVTYPDIRSSELKAAGALSIQITAALRARGRRGKEE